jgi:hypothetical protein
VSIGGIRDWSHAPPRTTSTPSQNWSGGLYEDPAGELPSRSNVMGCWDRKGILQVWRGSEIRRKRNNRNVSETSFRILGLAASLQRASIHRGYYALPTRSARRAWPARASTSGVFPTSTPTWKPKEIRSPHPFTVWSVAGSWPESLPRRRSICLASSGVAGSRSSS